MKLSSAFSLLTDLRLAIQHAFLPTLWAIWANPTLLFHVQELSRIFMSHVWVAFGDGVDENGSEVKKGLIPQATGVVLDLGAGHGHTVKYLDHDKITKYVAIEPNELMHPEIRKVANAAGYTESAGTLLILPYGAEQIELINSALGGSLAVDSIISILTICSIPSPEETLGKLVGQVLKPGGQFLFYEHVLSPREDVAWWQRFWTPIWLWAFDGCRLDRPTHLWVDKLDCWESRDIWGKEGEAVENLFWHRVGRFVKA